MESFTELQRKVHKLEGNYNDPEFRETVKKCLKAASTPEEARWVYEVISRHYTTYDLRGDALIKCFNLTQSSFFEPKINYDFLWWLVQELPNGQEKKWTAEACLLAAKDISQINDYLYTYADHGLYWQIYIALAKNVRQIRYAVKFCCNHLKVKARQTEALMWLKMGQLVPDELSPLY
jgi:hypothetical protein